MHPDQPVSTETLLQEVWDHEKANPDVVWIYITFLRAKLRSIHADFSIIGEQHKCFCLKRNDEIT